jgi:hypothetical protein
MTGTELLTFLRAHRLAVEASVSKDGSPQAAVVGFVVSDDLELFFDTLGTSRKAANLRLDPRIALVIGWSLSDARTVQIEGVADEPKGHELARLKNLYLAAFPDGHERESLTDIAYVRVRPTWIRYSDFRGAEPSIVELDPRALRTQLT